MTSATLGPTISDIEITNVSKHGFWMLLDDEELFLSFVDFPWFRDAAIGALVDVTRPSAHHLHWPALDIDLAVDSIRDPTMFPLLSRFNQVGAISSRAKPSDIEKAVLDAHPDVEFRLGAPFSIGDGDNEPLRYPVLVNGSTHANYTYRTVVWPKIKASLRKAFPLGSANEVRVVADSYPTDID